MRTATLINDVKDHRGRNVHFCINNDFQFPLYKYIQKQHLDTFLNHGTLQIGTMYHYTDESRYGPSADFLEGLNCMILDNPPNGMLISKALNQYMYCVSKTYSKLIAHRFGTDACLKINSPRFFTEITRRIPRGISSAVVGSVNYVNKIGYHQHDPDTSLFAGLYKDNGYAVEEEVRCVWELRKKDRYNATIKASVDVEGAFSLSAHESPHF